MALFFFLINTLMNIAKMPAQTSKRQRRVTTKEKTVAVFYSFRRPRLALLNAGPRLFLHGYFEGFFQEWDWVNPFRQ